MCTERRYEYIYGGELQALIAERPLAWVPLGILEKHGEHLPWGLDALKAHGVCMHLADKLGGAVLPATHLAGVHQEWDPDPKVAKKMMAEVGDFYLRERTFRMLLQDTIVGLANIGFEVIVLYTGHYPDMQIEIVQDEATKATQAGVAHVIGFDERSHFKDGDHAGKWETAIYMAVDGKVRMNKVKPEQGGQLGYWTESSPPTDANKEFGKEVLQKLELHFYQITRRVLEERSR